MYKDINFLEIFSFLHINGKWIKNLKIDLVANFLGLEKELFKNLYSGIQALLLCKNNIKQLELRFEKERLDGLEQEFQQLGQVFKYLKYSNLENLSLNIYFDTFNQRIQYFIDLFQNIKYSKLRKLEVIFDNIGMGYEDDTGQDMYNFSKCLTELKDSQINELCLNLQNNNILSNNNSIQNLSKGIEELQHSQIKYLKVDLETNNNGINDKVNLKSLTHSIAQLKLYSLDLRFYEYNIRETDSKSIGNMLISLTENGLQNLYFDLRNTYLSKMTLIILGEYFKKLFLIKNNNLENILLYLGINNIDYNDIDQLLKCFIEAIKKNQNLQIKVYTGLYDDLDSLQKKYQKFSNLEIN